MVVFRLFHTHLLPPSKFDITRLTSHQCSIFLHRAVSLVSNSSVTPLKGRENLPSTSVTKKVKQATKDFGCFTIVLGGLTLTGAILFTIVRELFSSKSPNSVYSDAFKICKADQRVLDLLGSSIKAHGDQNSRGRRKYITLDY
ncbi:unnamed protein product [Heterobilharzia americana]|nr:unnamed protein product [Heterobilharzia americana]